MKFKIGKVESKNNLILAPMAGVTTSSFRKICLKHGAGIVYAEMISDKGLEYNNEKTLKMIEIDQDEHPIAMQVFGNSYETITPSVGKILERSNVDIIDVNMGCPVNKVVKGGSGSALLKTPDKIYDIVKSLKDNYDIPITVKIRAGWDASSINCDQVTKLATKAGVDAIAIHGRTRAQMYNGNANLEYIKMVRDSTDKVVIGNGDIKDYASAKRMLEETNVDALMIGRASLGNPWVFEEIEKGLIVKTSPAIGLKRKIRPINRLDKNTSGIVIFAKNEIARNEILEAFKNNNIHKRHGCPTISRKIKLHDTNRIRNIN